MAKERVTPETGEIVSPGQGGEVVPMAKWLEALPMATDTEEMSEAIAMRILNAKTMDEALTPASAESLQDHLDATLIIHDARLARSSYKGGPGGFAIMDVETVKTGEHFVATCGATNVLAQLVKAYTEKAFPLSCRVIQTVSGSTPNRKPLWLVLPETPL